MDIGCAVMPQEGSRGGESSSIIIPPCLGLAMIIKSSFMVHKHARYS
jgi:hypothetical protein